MCHGNIFGKDDARKVRAASVFGTFACVDSTFK
ncbi:hypothetical protein GGD55_000894 [Rhizobium giardinii]|uniref:Uncharacterized protein n=1 Tax=Rhizobium giardinii TaxID=56731 RepID=A0A7W8U7L2_9HYPH|nr:hypothetical protein [Rhizobium giardinii]